MTNASAANQKVLALIPAYNEDRHIAGVVDAVKTYLPVLVVDDGSQDTTAARAGAAGATVLRQESNQGKGVALRSGFRWALEHGYQALVMLDADGQHDPDEIPLFLSTFRRLGSDLLIGERSFSKMPLLRRLTNTFGRWSFSWALGQADRDNQSGYRLLSRRMMEATLDSKEHGFEFEVDMIVICVERGYRLDWVAIQTIYGDEKSHIKPLPHVINWFRIIFETRRRIQAAKKEARKTE